MPAERYGFEVSAWVRPKFYAALREDVNRAITLAVEQAIAAERERCAKLVPTNWCDQLLTGEGAAELPLSGRAVEALLRGVQDRIRAHGQR